MISEDIKALREWTTMPDGPLSSRLTRVLDALEKRTAALEYVVAHEHSNLEVNPDVHRHDRYRENMYWKARAALLETESLQDASEASGEEGK